MRPTVPKTMQASVYRGLPKIDTRPPGWVAVVGIGGLGHLAVPYAVAMGYRVATVDMAEEQLFLARELGAEMLFTSRTEEVPTAEGEVAGGTHAALVTPASSSIISGVLPALRPGGTCDLSGLHPGKFPVDVPSPKTATKSAHARKDMGPPISTRFSSG